MGDSIAHQGAAGEQVQLVQAIRVRKAQTSPQTCAPEIDAPGTSMGAPIWRVCRAVRDDRFLRWCQPPSVATRWRPPDRAARQRPATPCHAIDRSDPGPLSCRDVPLGAHAGGLAWPGLQGRLRLPVGPAPSLAGTRCAHGESRIAHDHLSETCLCVRAGTEVDGARADTGHVWTSTARARMTPVVAEPSPSGPWPWAGPVS